MLSGQPGRQHARFNIKDSMTKQPGENYNYQDADQIQKETCADHGGNFDAVGAKDNGIGGCGRG